MRQNKEFLLTSNQKFRVSGLCLWLFLLSGAGQCRAQITSPPQNAYLLQPGGLNTGTVPDSASTDHAAAADSSASVAAQAGTSADDDGWHFAVSPYLWFPGVHGTIGVLGRDISFKASPGDLLSHFRFGLMGLVEARYKRVLLPLDIMWIRLEDDKALPFPNLMVNTAKLKASEFILTPKIGYRLIDEEKIKIDALVGFRYWHFGENLKFVPSNFNLNFSNSQNWVDPVVGGCITGNLSSKVAVVIAGDVGGWGTGSQLDYQVAGILGYSIKPKVTLQAGYRYLYVNYRSGGTIIQPTTSGVLFGATFNLK
jgi:hypothetical protein